jgi:hypothetical protein
MPLSPQPWKRVTESAFPWEAEALEYPKILCPNGGATGLLVGDYCGKNAEREPPRSLWAEPETSTSLIIS